MNTRLYRELTAQELTGIFAAALHTDVVSARLLSGGLFNTTYLVQTRDCGDAVLRVGPVNRQLLMPFEHRLMQAEARVYALCAARGLPVSEVLAVDTTKTRIDRDYMIVRYLPSRPMSEAELTPEERAGVARGVGETLGAMHRISAPRFGRVADAEDGGGFGRWSECVWNELLRWEDVAVPARIYTADEHRRLREVFRRAEALLDEVRAPGLVHMDAWTGNILITESAGKKRFGALIDADRAMWADPEMEFSSIQWMVNEPEFWQGYGRPFAEDDRTARRRSLYRLLYALWDSYVYFVEYEWPEPGEDQRGRMRRLLAELEQ